MNCDGVRGLLSAYLDSQLSPGDLLRTEQHLRRCHGCAMEVDSLRQTLALVSSLDEVEVPASFHASLHARLVAIGPPVAASAGKVTALQRGLRNWALSGTAAVAAAAMLTLGILQWPRAAQQLPGILASNSPVTIDPSGTSSPLPVASPSALPNLAPSPAPTPGVQPTQPVPTGTITTPPVAHADPATPPPLTATLPPVENAPAPTPGSVPPVVVSPPVVTVPTTIGSVVQSKLSAHAVSYLSGVIRVTSGQTKVSHTHIFTVQANETGMLASEMVSRFGGRAQVTQNHVGNLTSSSSIIITLDKVDLPDGLDYVRLLLGGQAIESDVVETDHSASLQLAESRMVMLDAARERRYQDALDLADSEEFDQIRRELDDYLDQFELAKVDLGRLRQQVNQATIIVYLNKQVQ